MTPPSSASFQAGCGIDRLAVLLHVVGDARPAPGSRCYPSPTSRAIRRRPTSRTAWPRRCAPPCSRAPSLKVIGRTSCERFRDADAVAAARALGVANVLDRQRQALPDRDPGLGRAGERRGRVRVLERDLRLDAWATRSRRRPRSGGAWPRRCCPRLAPVHGLRRLLQPALSMRAPTTSC